MRESEKAKITLGKPSGLNQIVGRDDWIEEPYWWPSLQAY